jgi:hypothetical protein
LELPVRFTAGVVSPVPLEGCHMMYGCSPTPDDGDRFGQNDESEKRHDLVESCCRLGLARVYEKFSSAKTALMEEWLRFLNS